METPRKKVERTTEGPASSERAHSVALKYGEEVFSGKTIEDAEVALAAKYPDFGNADESVQIGFATEDGKFLSRKEAFDLLVKEGEVNRSTQNETA